jgi:hypothetical protein
MVVMAQFSWLLCQPETWGRRATKFGELHYIRNNSPNTGAEPAFAASSVLTSAAAVSRNSCVHQRIDTEIGRRRRGKPRDLMQRTVATSS